MGQSGSAAGRLRGAEDILANGWSGRHATLTPQNLGNEDLKPEVGEELEAGFDAGLFNERIGARVHVVSQEDDGRDRERADIPSGGFPGKSFQNIGAVENQGTEYGITAEAIRRENSASTCASSSRTTRTRVLTSAVRRRSSSTRPFGSYHVTGFPIGGIFRRAWCRPTSTAAARRRAPST